MKSDVERWGEDTLLLSPEGEGPTEEGKTKVKRLVEKGEIHEDGQDEERGIKVDEGRLVSFLHFTSDAECDVKSRFFRKSFQLSLLYFDYCPRNERGWWTMCVPWKSSWGGERRKFRWTSYACHERMRDFWQDNLLCSSCLERWWWCRMSWERKKIPLFVDTLVVVSDSLLSLSPSVTDSVITNVKNNKNSMSTMIVVVFALLFVATTTIFRKSSSWSYRHQTTLSIDRCIVFLSPHVMNTSTPLNGQWWHTLFVGNNEEETEGVHSLLSPLSFSVCETMREGEWPSIGSAWVCLS